MTLSDKIIEINGIPHIWSGAVKDFIEEIRPHMITENQIMIDKLAGDKLT